MIGERDLTRLKDMVEYAEKAVSFSGGVAGSDLADDEVTLFATIRCIEVIGEAAAHVSADTRSRISDLPWPSIVGMRNSMIHGYWKVAGNIVALTVRDRLPALILSLRAFIAENEAP